MIWILLFLITTGLSTKIYFEFENHIYELNMAKMEEINIKATVEHKTLDMDGYEIHYYVSGQSNTKSMVFLHPAFSDHHAFDAQVDYFSTSYKVITIDLIGHGLSKANQSKDKIDASALHINAILEKESVTKANFIGVSIGSLIAQHFTIQHPEKVQSLVGLGGYNINKKNKQVEKAQRSVNFGLLFRALISMKNFRKKTAELTCHTKEGQALFFNSTKHYKRKSFLVMDGLQHIIKNRDNKITIPTLIMTGEFDIPLAHQMAKQWHQNLINSEYFIIKNTGHGANMDDPLTFNKKVETFINKIN